MIASVRGAVDTTSPLAGPQRIDGWFIEAPDGLSGNSETRELVSDERLEHRIAKVIRNQEIDGVPRVAVFDKRNGTAFRPATVGCHHMHDKLSRNIQAHVKLPDRVAEPEVQVLLGNEQC